MKEQLATFTHVYRHTPLSPPVPACF